MGSLLRGAVTHEVRRRFQRSDQLDRQLQARRQHQSQPQHPRAPLSPLRGRQRERKNAPAQAGRHFTIRCGKYDEVAVLMSARTESAEQMQFIRAFRFVSNKLETLGFSTAWFCFPTRARLKIQSTQCAGHIARSGTIIAGRTLFTAGRTPWSWNDSKPPACPGE